MTSGYLYYDGYKYVLHSSVAGRKGDKGDKGDDGDIGLTGSYADGYSSLAIEKAFYNNLNEKYADQSEYFFTNTISSDILTDYSISASIIDIDCSEKTIYFITDAISTTPIYGIDNFSNDLIFNPTLSESIQWKEIKYARLNGIEIIALTSDNGFAYYDITNSTYYSTSTNSVTSNCSKMYVDSTEVSFFTDGKIYVLTSDGTNLSLDFNTVQPTRNSVGFHKAFGYYYNCDSLNASMAYKTDLNSSFVTELDLGNSNATSIISSDSEYIYFFSFSEDIKKVSFNDFEIKESIDLENIINLGLITPYFVKYDGSKLIIPVPNINKIVYYYPSIKKFNIISPGVSMDICCYHNNYGSNIGYLLSGGSNIVSLSYKKRELMPSTFTNGGVYKKPTYVDNTLSPYTVQYTDSVIVCATSTGAITIDLPSDINFFGMELVIVDSDGSASTNNITISGVNANNGAGKTISTNFARAVAYCYNTDSGPDSYWVVS